MTLAPGRLRRLADGPHTRHGGQTPVTNTIGDRRSRLTLSGKRRERVAVTPIKHCGPERRTNSRDANIDQTIALTIGKAVFKSYVSAATT